MSRLWQSSCTAAQTVKICVERGRRNPASLIQDQDFMYSQDTTSFSLVAEKFCRPIEMAQAVTSTRNAWHHAPLALIGLLALADLDIVAQRTAFNGTSQWSDILIICPGLHRQHKATRLSDGEFPACAAMTTGYVFRIENPATVFYLQSVSATGKLTNISVSKADAHYSRGDRLVRLASGSSVVAFAMLASLGDWWALSYLLTLVIVRFISTVIIRAQARVDWHGQSEPGQLGDLFVLLSYDRWIRLRGEVDNLKAVTSGRWLRQPTISEDTLSGCATLLAYAAPVLVANANSKGQAIIAILLLSNAAALATANCLTTSSHMKDRTLQVQGMRKAYERRSVLASELIAESGRDDWAVAMGLIPSGSSSRTSVVM
jgi:hypothetical protein